MFDDVRPYMQIPFQFSLHTVKEDETKHYEYLHDSNDDPRLSFLKALKESLSNEGLIIVYNESFEKARLKELALLYPEYSNWVETTITRFIDLLIPFRNFHYYNPKQQGSASIKKVLPALTGTNDYENMEIADGGTASAKYFEMISNEKLSEEEKEKIRNNLLKYCELDTKTMIMIKEELEKLVG